MRSRAPRFGQIEIPLSLFCSQGKEYSCACLNISASGAFLRFLDEHLVIRRNMEFRTKIVKDGKLSETWLRVERVETDGVGVRFIEVDA